MSISKKNLLVTAAILVSAYIAWVVVYNVQHDQKSVDPVTSRVVTPPNVAELTTLVNLERVTIGVPALIKDEKLTVAAQTHCDEMLVANVYSHDMPDGRTPLNYIQAQYGTQVGFTAAENNSYGWPDSTSVVSGWMGSEGHKVNLLDSKYTREGLAVCKATNFTAPGLPQTDGYLVVQLFMSEPVAPAPTPVTRHSSLSCSSFGVSSVTYTNCY